MELLRACTETGYDRNVAYVMSLLRKYVEDFVPLTTEDLKERHLYLNLLSECTKHVEKKLSQCVPVNKSCNMVCQDLTHVYPCLTVS